MGEQRRVQQNDEQTLRDQEVMRANREIAAYLRGRRTEREARAALKILRAYIRARARMDPKTRPPLPGVKPAKDTPGTTRKSKRSSTSRRKPPKRAAAVAPTEASPRPPDEPQSGDD